MKKKLKYLVFEFRIDRHSNGADIMCSCRLSFEVRTLNDYYLTLELAIASFSSFFLFFFLPFFTENWKKRLHKFITAHSPHKDHWIQMSHNDTSKTTKHSPHLHSNTTITYSCLDVRRVFMNSKLYYIIQKGERIYVCSCMLVYLKAIRLYLKKKKNKKKS